MDTSKLKGRFIVLEGIEGSGKSTLSKSLLNHYQSLNKKVLITREPGGTPLGNKLRDLILSQENQVCPLSELFMIEAARAQHCRDVILPALETHDYVICDRFTLSSLAYQGKARGLGLDFVHQLNQQAIGTCQPDLVFLLDLTVEEALGRRTQRHRQNNVGLDKMEQESLSFHRIVASGYEEAKAYEKNLVSLSALLSPEALLKAVTEQIG